MRKMRADKRSFSFTWMRGQNQKSTGEINPAASISDVPGELQNEKANAAWFMTTASSTSSSSGVSSMSESLSITSTSTSTSTNQGTVNNKDLEKETGTAELTRNDSSKGRLRRLGSSFTRFGTKYSIIEDDDENMEGEAIISSDNAENGMPTATPNVPVNSEPVAATATSTDVDKELHFDEDGNFIGRHGKASASRRKSLASGRDNASTSSFGRKINKTVQDVKASIGSFSQRFRRSTRRRYRMGPGTPLTEITPTRKILGRTPTKLYSPFGIGFDSPAMNLKTPKRLDRPSTPRLTRRSVVSGLVYSPANTVQVYSPANNFRQDLADARRGMEDFHILSRDITRRSVRF